MARNESFNVGRNIDFSRLAGLDNTSKAPAKQETLKPNPATVPEPVVVPQSQTKEVVKPVLESEPEKSSSAIIKDEKPSKQISEPEKIIKQDITAPISLAKKAKENLSVHKNFLLKPSLADKLTTLAKELETSQNALINEILTQVFESIENK